MDQPTEDTGAAELSGGHSVTAKRRDPSERKRLVVVCSAAQHEIVKAAAGRASAGSKPDVSSWVLAHALAAARSSGGDGAPVVVAGPPAERLRRFAAQHGISAVRAVEQLLIAAEVEA